jgi:hypothetical protein
MTGYVRTDTTNNIADGNIINATDLDNEFDGIQAAFNSSTGHNHDGTTGEGAPILVLGPTQDVVVGASAVTPKTTNTVDVGSSSLKFKDLWLAGNASIGGTLAVTGVATLTAQPVLSSLTASRAVFTDGSKGLVSNAITGTGNVVMSASPTLTGTIGGENATLSGTLAVTGVATLTAQPIVSSLTASRAVFSDGSKGLVSNAITGTGNVVMSASPTLTGTINAEALTTSSTVTLNGGTANGVAFLNGSKVLTTGSALTFDGVVLLSGAGGTGTNNSVLRLSGSNASGYGAYLQFLRNGTPTWSIGNDSAINGGSSDDLTIYGTASQRFYASSAEQMRLTSTGLGIGTSSPAFKLSVQGSAIIAGANPFLAFGADAGVASTPTYIERNGTTGLQTFFNNGTGTNGAMAFVIGAGSEGMRLDSSGNLGLGVAPSAWRSTWKAMEFGRVGNAVFGGDSGSSIEVVANTYVDSANTYRYANNGAASDYYQVSGQHVWYTAPSGTAGDAISFSQAMTLDASGNLGVGATSPTARLHVLTGSTYAANFYTTNTGAGTTRIAIGGYSTVTSGGGGSAAIGAEHNHSANAQSSLTFYTHDGTNQLERARIDSSGNLIQTVNTTAATLATNGTLTFSIVDNSTLRISVRGSDGTTRTATVALT